MKYEKAKLTMHDTQVFFCCVLLIDYEYWVNKQETLMSQDVSQSVSYLVGTVLSDVLNLRCHQHGQNTKNKSHTHWITGNVDLLLSLFLNKTPLNLTFKWNGVFNDFCPPK